MCLQGGGPRGLCVTSWRCQTPGIAVKHALAHVAICSVTRQHLGVPQTTEDEHGRQRRTVDPEAGTRAIDRPRSLLAGVWARRGVHLAYHVLQTAWRVFRQSCQEFGCRADARGGYATLVTTRDSSTPTRIITTQSRELATAPASVIRCARHAGRARLLFWPSGTAHQAVAPHNAYVSTVPRPGRTTRCRPLAHGDRRTLVQAPDSA